MSHDVGTRKKRKILALTAEGASLGDIQKLAYVSRPTAIKYRRLYKKAIEQEESTIVQKITQEPESNQKESLVSMIKRKIFGKILTNAKPDDEPPAGGEISLHGLRDSVSGGASK